MEDLKQKEGKVPEWKRDLELFNRWKSERDQTAATDLFFKYNQLVHRTVLKHLSTSPVFPDEKAEAEEITNEAFSEAFDHNYLARNKAKFSTLVITIAYHIIADRYADRIRLLEISVDKTEGTFAESSFQNKVLQKHFFDTFLKLLTRQGYFSPESKLLLKLRVDGYSYREIAGNSPVKPENKLDLSEEEQQVLLSIRGNWKETSLPVLFRRTRYKFWVGLFVFWFKRQVKDREPTVEELEHRFSEKQAFIIYHRAFTGKGFSGIKDLFDEGFSEHLSQAEIKDKYYRSIKGYLRDEGVFQKFFGGAEHAFK